MEGADKCADCLGKPYDDGTTGISRLRNEL
jgi:hypothetical protein